MSTLKIYVINCINNKYYIGKTSKTIDEVLSDHMSGSRHYTSIHTPLTITLLKDSADNFDEDKFVLEYMNKYGIDNVRGGSYSKEKLSENEILEIKKKLNTVNNNCYSCSGHGHFIKDCPNKHCNRCGRNSHNEDKCYAKTDINGKVLMKCVKCGRNNHIEDKCYAKTDINGKVIIETTKEINSISNHYQSIIPPQKETKLQETISNPTNISPTIYKSETFNSYTKCIESLKDKFNPSIIKEALDMIEKHDQNSFIEYRKINESDTLFVKGNYNKLLFFHLKEIEIWIQ
jgi:hypothetical protein